MINVIKSMDGPCVGGPGYSTVKPLMRDAIKSTRDHVYKHRYSTENQLKSNMSTISRWGFVHIAQCRGFVTNGSQ